MMKSRGEVKRRYVRQGRRAVSKGRKNGIRTSLEAMVSKKQTEDEKEVCFYLGGAQ